MTVFEDIDKAIKGIFIDNDFGLPVAFENVFYDETDAENYIAVFQLPAPTVQATLGDSGCDYHAGLIQVDINYRSFSGSSVLTKKSDEINAIVKSGATFTNNGLNVRIQNVSRERLIISDGFAKLIMSIEYYAFNARN